MNAPEHDAASRTGTLESASAGAPAPAAAGADPRELSFERYQRARLAADVLTRLFAGRRGVRLLELGGAPDGLARFLPDGMFRLERTSAMDALPFPDDGFDAVVACDALVRVPTGRRVSVAREVARVARRAALLVGAFRGTQRLAIEPADAAPVVPAEREPLAAALAERGLRVVTLGHGSLERALAVEAVARDSTPAELRRWRREFNELLYQEEPTPPFLRHALVAYGSGVKAAWLDALESCAEAPEPGERLSVRFPGEPAPAPTASGGAPRPDVEDREDRAAREAERREALRRERDRLAEEAAGLRTALLQVHADAERARLEVQNDLERLGAELEDRERAHESAQARAERELDRARRTLERERERGQDLERRLESRERVIDAQAARHLARLAEIEEDRRLHREQLEEERAALHERLEELRAENATLEVELRGFWRNLRRAVRSLWA